MRTTDRRDQLVRMLRRKADWTVADLVRELHVSRRTVLRDLGVLREIGFDIRTFSGPGGGVRLNPASVMATSQLAASEVVALIISAEIAHATKTVPFAAAVERALAKIEQALPATRAEELRALHERILIGEPALNTGLTHIDPNLVEAFERAFSTTRLLVFDYRDQQGRNTHRRVEPQGLLVRQPLWYVIAWDFDQQAARLFRADRISTPTVDDRTFIARPYEFVTGVCPDAKRSVVPERPAHLLACTRTASDPADRFPQDPDARRRRSKTRELAQQVCQAEHEPAHQEFVRTVERGELDR